MKPRIIKTEKEHGAALSRIDELMEGDPALATDAGRELELLAMLVEEYEDIHEPMDDPDPVEFIKFRMEQGGLRQVDVAEYFGGRNRASEVLSRKRPLTLEMIRRLNAGLGIPAEVLILEARTEASKTVRGRPLAEGGRLSCAQGHASGTG